MKIGIITGASSGLGRELLINAAKMVPDIDEFFIVARSKEGLEAAAATVEVPCRIIPLDLTEKQSAEKLADKISSVGGDVRLLVNNSGCGYFGDFEKNDASRFETMIALNIRALTEVTHAVLPFMRKGSAVLNVSSIASFCPNAGMTVYSSTKAYVTSFSRGLRYELRERGINVCAVCPGPMDTAFLTRGDIKGKSKTFDVLPYCKVSAVARGALRATLRGRAIYTPSAFYKFYRILAKVLPHSAVIPMAKT